MRPFPTALSVWFLLTLTPAQARQECIARGLDAARIEGTAFATGGAFGARVRGCYVPAEDLVICAVRDERCLAHELSHARGEDHFQTGM